MRTEREERGSWDWKGRCNRPYECPGASLGGRGLAGLLVGARVCFCARATYWRGSDWRIRGRRPSSRSGGPANRQSRERMSMEAMEWSGIKCACVRARARARACKRAGRGGGRGRRRRLHVSVRAVCSQFPELVGRAV